MNRQITKLDFFGAVLITLFVLTIIGAVGSHGREYAKRTVCLQYIKRHVSVHLLWAAEHDDYFPVLGRSVPWFWDIDAGLVNLMLDNGLKQENFYCPSNPTMQKNMKTYWNFITKWDGTHFIDAGGYVPSGYCYVLQTPAHDRPPIMGSGQKQWLTNVNVNNPSEAELVMDALVSQDITSSGSAQKFGEITVGGLYRIHGIYDRTNHLKDLEHPWGSNIGFVDGHVTWRPFTSMEMRWSQDSNFWW